MEPDSAARGVTLLPLRWPPIKLGATVPKDQLTAAVIERPVFRGGARFSPYARAHYARARKAKNRVNGDLHDCGVIPSP